MGNRKRISLNEKIKILQECKSGFSLSAISNKYGISKSSICTLKKMENKIVSNLEGTNNGSKNRRLLRKGEYPDMEEKLYEWFLKQRKKFIPVNGMGLKAKALEIHARFCSGGFNASDGWLGRFKKRYGIRLLKESGEKLSSRDDLVEPFKRKLQKTILEEGLTHDLIFNADETGLCWKMLPDKTYVHAGEETAPGRKLSKERITALFCANASGKKKVTPLLIGKAKKPRSFRNKILPVNYLHSKNAWMNCGIFKIWFFEMFVPEVESYLETNNLPLKALLILDNAPSHPPAEELVKSTREGKIWTMFMPPNVTPLIQPMDQNAIRLVKLHYRNSLLSKLITSEVDDVLSFLKNLNLYDASCMIALAWKNIDQHLLEKCWSKVLIHKDSEFDEEDDIPLARILEGDEFVSIRRGVRLLSTVFQNIPFNAEDLNVWNQNDNFMSDEEDDENEQNSVDIVVPVADNETKIKHAEEIKCFDKCIQWSQQNNISFTKSLVLREIQEEAVQKSLQIEHKQTTLNNFFNVV